MVVPFNVIIDSMMLRAASTLANPTEAFAANRINFGVLEERKPGGVQWSQLQRHREHFTNGTYSVRFHNSGKLCKGYLYNDLIAPEASVCKGLHKH